MNPLKTAMPCAEEHQAHTEVYGRAELNQAFGPTAVGMIPLHPGWAQLNNDSGAPVFLSRLECGHFAMTSPTTVEAARKAQQEEIFTPEEGTAREALAQLLADARAGKTVDPHDVAAAKERIALDELAEEGRAERAAAAQAKAEAEAREALITPLQELLESSSERVHELHAAALQAILALLEAVDEHMQDHDEAVSQLTDAGMDPEEVRPPARGYLQEIVIGDQRFPYFAKQEYLVSLLNAIRHGGKHRNAFYGIQGRDLSAAIPPNIANGPNPEE